MSRRAWKALGIVALAAVALAGWVAWANLRGEAPLDALPAPASTPEAVARGAYLARLGNCMACHTQVGGAPYAGGRGVETPFGIVFAPNLTPDADTGLGRWSAAEFWRAMHHGRSRDGRLLTPAFPYPHFTQVTRADADALYAYLHSLPPVVQSNRPHALRFPFGTQPAIAVWRALFFTPGAPEHDAAQSADWNRGAYLVNGLGHCAACHSPRNAFGATAGRAFAGGLIPVQNWYAPALDAAVEAGVADWPEDDVVALLRTGVAPRGSVMGPMAEVVFRSTQYLSEADARAVAVYLQALPPRDVPAPANQPPPAQALRRGAQVYEQHCATCHGVQGEGRPGVFPALAGNRAVTMAQPTNVVRAILQGGYAPATAGNPRPYGMPPFMHVLGDDDVAAVASYVRNAWANGAPGVATMDVYRIREGRP